MREWIEDRPDVQVQGSEYRRLLGYPPHVELEGRARDLADQTRAWFEQHGRPWIALRVAANVASVDGRVSVDGCELTSAELAERFSVSKVTGAFFALVSAGPECEARARALWEDGKPDEYFFLEAYGSAVVEHLIAQAAYQLCAWADRERLAVLPHYSPGYPGWEICDQRPLLEAAQRAGSRSWPGRVSVLDSGMLVPRKSLLALFGIAPASALLGRQALEVPCERCSLPRCQYRRLPYRHPLRQTEDVRRMSRGNEEHASTESELPAYSLAHLTLEKWSRERLRLDRLDDGTIQGRFRYDGSTCSNMGRPLQFEYRVTLRPTSTGFTIAAADCAPTPDDSGHTFMCRYRDHGPAFIEAIRNEQPLLGRSLDDVLRQQRTFAPAGCYCEPSARHHKWGLVFEVLHYALMRRQKMEGS
jgi:hypothetical protein